MTSSERQLDPPSAVTPEPARNYPAELRLQEAVECLKTIFDSYEKPPVEHCVDTMGGPIPDEERIAWAKSPWEYRPRDMDLIWHSFFWWMPPPAGREQHARTTKYWLPRLLYGLSAGETGPVFDADFIANNLSRADWLNWPANEVAAVQTWCAAWLWACVDFNAMEDRRAFRPVCRSLSESMLFAVAIGLDLSFVLAEVIGNLRPHDVAAIKDVVAEFAPQIIRRDLLEDVHDLKVPALRALLIWMLNPVTSERLESAFFHLAETDKALVSQISEVTDWIDNLRKSYMSDPRGAPHWLAAASNDTR